MKRISGIEALLASKYPSHESLSTCLSALRRNGITELSDLKNKTTFTMSEYAPDIFIIALTDHLEDHASGVGVVCDVTLFMNLHCSVTTTSSLRPENYSPVLKASQDPTEAAQVSEGTSSWCIPEESVQLELYNHMLVELLWPTQFLKRQCYIAMEQKLQQEWQEGSQIVSLTGASGTGKTTFLIYMLSALMKEYHPVVLMTKGGECFFYEPPPRDMAKGYRCYMMESTRVSFVLSDKSVYFLADEEPSDLPPFFGKALLVCAPTRRYLRAAEIALPAWSAAEIALAWQEIFEPIAQEDPTGKHKPLTLEIVSERYRKWGGSCPREIFKALSYQINSF